MDDLYPMVFKRKSIRKFDKKLSISEEELAVLETKIDELKPLKNDIKVRFSIVKRKQTTAKRGEYCLLMYSEEKPFYLQNAGYMLEQIDLYLASCDIGVCWYGVAKPLEKQYAGLKYIIMLAFGKCSSDDFRKEISEYKRKPVNSIWQGNHFSDIAEVVRIAPSGCNLQPWRITSSNNEIKVFKYAKTERFPNKKLALYTETDFSLIDMGICLCYLEICLSHKSYSYERQLHKENEATNLFMDIADYTII
jgi:hypothetical protein